MPTHHHIAAEYSSASWTGLSKQHVCNPSKNSSSICCFAFQYRPRRPTSRSRCEDGLTVLETVALCKYLEGLPSASQLQPHANTGLTAISSEASFFGELRQDVAQDSLSNSKVEAMHPILMHAINMEPRYREKARQDGCVQLQQIRQICRMLAVCSGILKIIEVERAMLLACGAQLANLVLGKRCI